MEILKFRKDCTDWVTRLKHEGKNVGFVPTMGALHEGHLSLVRKSKEENDITFVSIFVNPKQFNDKEDLKNYPRNLEADLKVLSENHCDFAFVPEVEEMYPDNKIKKYDFNGLDEVMEGAHRPGHFSGVANIVEKLFLTINADNAYFGQKDFQQLVIIKHLVKKLGLQINIRSCEIIREPDGLAMSSRNQLLTHEHRKYASVIYETLKQSKQFYKEIPVEELKQWVIGGINTQLLFQTEYVEIVNDINLQPITHWETDGNIYGCVAVKAGKIRLIDNVKYNS